LNNYAAASNQQQHEMCDILLNPGKQVTPAAQHPTNSHPSPKTLTESNGHTSNSCTTLNVNPSVNPFAVFAGATIHGGTFNIHIHQSSPAAPPIPNRKRTRVLYDTDSQ